MVPVADQQILRGTVATLAWQYLDSDGDPADPGTTTVGVTRADGTTVVAPLTATGGTGSDPRTVALTAAQTATLDVLVATWTAGGVTYTTSVEIVGGYMFTTAEARGSDPVLADTNKYPTDTLVRYRRDITDEFERICDVAFVPRYRRERLNGTGGSCILLPTARVRRVTAAGQYDTAGVLTAYSVSDVGAIVVDGSVITSQARSLPCGHQNVLVAWEHGFDQPPPDVKQAALLRLRHRATRPKSAVPDRAQSFQIEGGTVYRLDTASADKTGIPEVDAVLARWSMKPPGSA